jgi:hypothetical protein
MVRAAAQRLQALSIMFVNYCDPQFRSCRWQACSNGRVVQAQDRGTGALAPHPPAQAAALKLHIAAKAGGDRLHRGWLECEWEKERGKPIRPKSRAITRC